MRRSRGSRPSRRPARSIRPTIPSRSGRWPPLLSRSATRSRAGLADGPRRADNLDHVPGLALVPVRDPEDGPIRSQRQEVDDPVAVQIGDRQGGERAEALRDGPRAGTGRRARSSRPGAAPGVEERGVRVAVLVEVGPGEVAEVGRPLEGSARR